MTAKPKRQEKKKPVPFGEVNRKRLIAEFLQGFGHPTAANAWEVVYRLLLWIDRTTGLAHCYESDKSQPGRAWYARALAFHSWLSGAMGRPPRVLGEGLDWLFRAALADYLKSYTELHARYRAKAAKQRAAFASEDFPLPGLDPEVRAILMESLRDHLSSTPADNVIETIAEKIRAYWKQENKRKNLLGEGFEDVLATLAEAAVGGEVRAQTRTSIADVPGFYPLGAKDKATKVDLVLQNSRWPRPVLVNVKWSIRADREDQLWDDFKEYVRFDRDQHGFDHYLVTNEFDPARLNAACDRREANSFVFKNVVHVNSAGILAAYSLPVLDGGAAEAGAESSMERVRSHISAGRLISLSTWLEELSR